jgi:WD40 repeat protein
LSWRGLLPGAPTPGDSRLITPETTPLSIPTKPATAPDPQRGHNVAPSLLDVKLLRDAKFAVLCCGDNTVRIWDIVSDQEVRCFVDDHSVDVCAITADGASLLAGNQIGHLHRFRLML